MAVYQYISVYISLSHLLLAINPSRNSKMTAGMNAAKVNDFIVGGQQARKIVARTVMLGGSLTCGLTPLCPTTVSYIIMYHIAFNI